MISINGKDKWRCIKVKLTPSHYMSSYFIHNISACVVRFLTQEAMGGFFVADLRAWWLSQGNSSASVEDSLNQPTQPFGICFLVTRYSRFLHEHCHFILPVLNVYLYEICCVRSLIEYFLSLREETPFRNLQLPEIRLGIFSFPPPGHISMEFIFTVSLFSLWISKVPSSVHMV